MSNNFRELLRQMPHKQEENNTGTGTGFGIKRSQAPSPEPEPAHQQAQVVQPSAEPIVQVKDEMKPVVEQRPSESIRRSRTVSQEDKDQVMGVKRIARLDVPLDVYGTKPKASQLHIYNKDLNRWLKDFTDENQYAGGCAINKSSLIEAILDVVMYDVGLEAQGFESVNDLREHLRSYFK